MTTKSEAWKYDHALNNLSVLDSDAWRVMKYLYEGCEGFVKIMSPNNRRGYFYSAEALCDPEKLSAILTSHRFEVSNLMMSMGTYKQMGKATQDRLFEIVALGVDVDYKNISGQEDVDPVEVMMKLESLYAEGYPRPSYVEYGRCLRLVYVLEKPYRIVKDQEKAKASKTFLKRIMQVLCDRLNAEKSFKYNAEVHKLTSFFRVPGSINRKYYYHINQLTDKIEIDEVELKEVKTTGFFGKWNIDELAKVVLPEKPIWLEGYQERRKKKQKTKNKTVRIYSKDFATRRLQELEELQSREYENTSVCKEKMCYLYWITARQSGMEEEEAKEAVLAFNKGFKCPLKRYRLLTDCKPSDYYDPISGYHREGWERKFSDHGIRLFLQMDQNEETDLFRGEGMTCAEKSKAYRERKKAEKALNGETKQAQLAMRREAVEAYRSAGKTWQEIADILNVGLRTAKRYGEHMREA